jgi:hypothetical protein
VDTRHQEEALAAFDKAIHLVDDDPALHALAASVLVRKAVLGALDRFDEARPSLQGIVGAFGQTTDGPTREQAEIAQDQLARG